jgi:site-specific DNA-methyltransferase (adenine-specific)
LIAALPPLSVDHMITDPPFNARTHDRGRAYGDLPDRCVTGEGFGFEPITDALMLTVAREASRVVRNWVLVFCAVEQISLWIGAFEGAGLDYVRTGVWIRQNTAPQFTGDRPAQGFEPVVIAHRPGRKKWNGGGFRVCGTTRSSTRETAAFTRHRSQCRS